MLERLARLADGHAKSVVVLGLVFLVVAGALGGGVAKRLDPFGADDPATESVIADRQLQNAGYRETGVVVLVRDVEARTADGRERIAAVARRLRGDRDVAAVASFLNTGSRDFISRDGRSTYLAVALRPTGDRARQDAAARIADALAHTPGVSVGGPALAERQVNEQVEHDLRTAELYAFPLLLVLALLFFRSLVAALLPLLVGGLAIVGTFLVLRLASELTSVSIFALNVATGLGLGLAIDYSLFIVSRYREEIARTGAGLEAMRRTLATAGRTVLFSSLTVAGALASLLVFPQRFLYSMGIAGVVVALIAAAISLTLLPAVLTLLGPRVNALAPAFLTRRAERSWPPASRSPAASSATSRQRRSNDSLMSRRDDLGDTALAAQTGHHQLELQLRRELPVPACLAQRALLVVERPILRGTPDAASPASPARHPPQDQQQGGCIFNRREGVRFQPALTVGSANATEAAVRGNGELLIELVGSKPALRIDSLLDASDGIGDLLATYEIAPDDPAEPQPDPRSQAEKEVRRLAALTFRGSTAARSCTWGRPSGVFAGNLRQRPQGLIATKLSYWLQYACVKVSGGQSAARLRIASASSGRMEPAFA
jgi:hypothetical protein